MFKLLLPGAVRIAIAILLLCVGLSGLSRSADPSGARVAFAAGGVDISLTGTGAAGSLAFTIGAAGCPNNLAPGDACTALVTITNAGSSSVTLSAPTASESGVLETCTGEDPGSPGSGGNNLSTAFSSLSYTPDVTTLNPSATATFNVTVTIAAFATNACQGKSGTVSVTVVATGEDGTGGGQGGGGDCDDDDDHDGHHHGGHRGDHDDDDCDDDDHDGHGGGGHH